MRSRKENKPERPATHHFGYAKCGQSHHMACDCRENQIFDYIKYLEEKLEKIDRKKKQK